QQQQQQQQSQSAPAYPPAVPPPEKPIGFSTPTTLKPLPSNQTRHRKSKLQSRTSMKEGTSSEEDASPRGNTESADKTADFTEKDLLLYIYGAQKAKMGPEMAKFDASLKSKSNLDLATTSRSSILPGNSLAAKIRQYLSSPVSWQPSADQRNLIGHMILQRLKNDNGDLGLKVAGGRSTANGRLGAFVTKVRPGSVADIVGQLRPGDEVLEWNGHCLQNASLEHVRQIVTSSKNDSQIELIVSRSMSMPGGDDFLNIRRSATGFSDYPDYRLSYENTITIDPTTGMRHSQTHTRPFLSARGVGEISPLAQQQQIQQPMTYNIPRVRNVSAGPSRQKFSVPDMPFSMSQQLISRQHSPLAMQAAINAAGTGQTMISQAQIFGTIEIALLYLPQERELIVNVLGALDLPPRRDGALRNPYAKLFLLPDRSEKSIRQTTVLAETISPQWNESFYYRNLTEPILMSRVLEVTVWDYDKYEANAFLGEVLIDFSTVLLDNQPFSYTLMEMDDENPVRLRLRNRRYSSSTPPPRPYSEMAHYKSSNLRKPRGTEGGGYRARIDDDYDTGEYDYGQHIPRSRTYDRAGIGGVITGGNGVQQQPHNSCYNCGSGTADWNINSTQTSGAQQNPAATSNGYISDKYATQMSSRYYSQRPHSATAIRKDPMLEGEDGSPHSQQQQQRYRTRPRHHRHSQDPSYRMSPLNSPYGLPEEPRQKPRRYEPPPMDPAAPLPPQHHQQQPQQQLPQQPILPPHMQSYNNGEYGSDGSETMSVNSAQSMQNRQIIRQHQQQQSQQQLPFSSEDGEGSSNSLRHQSYVNDDYGQNISMEEATQSDTTIKSGAQALKEMKERKKSLMTRLIPGRGAGAGMG
uniref:Regulating synaptic membrane exocytosis protein 2 n=1 Tax=Panagrolaimus sp. PS1159 TaxID=55785 RepID=A0AC35G8Z7_9BILA